MSESLSESSLPRRRFVARAGAVFSGLIAALLAAGWFIPPLRRWLQFGSPQPQFHPVGPVASLKPGVWQLMPLSIHRRNWWQTETNTHSVWVRRDGDGPGDIRVLSPICSHRGCAVNWKPERKAFVCPCHGGKFDVDGKRQAGPPSRSLDPLEFQIAEGQLLVHWQDFQQGTPTPVPVDFA
jgi:menaquinol-cytochrome c reductase iron-sulfur subunit